MNDEYKHFDESQPELIDQTMTPEIGKLALALSKAQGEITGAQKDSKNPFFKSNYADLGNVLAACREPLSRNELAVIQTTEPHESGVVLISTLVHSSGQWIRGKLRMKPTKNDPQGIGSTLTYARRYAYAAIVGVAQVDDDGNQASDNQVSRNMDGTRVDKKKLDAVVAEAIVIVDECDDDRESGGKRAREIYEPLTPDERIYVNGEIAKKKFKNQSTGRNVQYWKPFKEHLMHSAEREPGEDG